jgi:cyanophycin synthetase
VFTNVSADHLDMLGVRSIEGLLAVKATVVRATRRGGVAVLNADDPLVRSLAPELRASPMFVSRDSRNPTVVNHVAAGGKALVVRDGVMELLHGPNAVAITNLSDIPMSYGGRAAHMVENALCAAGAAVALGLSMPQIAAGMASFRNTPELNPGRLHVYETNGTTVVLDYAHNEVGLKHLLAFGRSFVQDGGKLVSVIGTAGDRSDEALRAIGEIAAEASDYVVIKETVKYLRGRESASGMTTLMAEGVGRVPGANWVQAPTELGGVELALQGRQPGDTVIVMCIEQSEEVRAMLEEIGTLVS